MLATRNPRRHASDSGGGSGKDNPDVEDDVDGMVWGMSELFDF